MSEHDNSLTTRKRRLPQRYYDTATTLRRTFTTATRWTPSEYTVTTGRQRAEITRCLSRLAAKADVEFDAGNVEGVYIESLRRLATWTEQGKADLSEAEKDADAARVAALAKTIGEKADEYDQAEHAKKFETPKTEPAAEPAKEKTERSAKALTFWLTRDTPHLGFVRGEGIAVTRTRELKVWDIASVKKKGEESSRIGRVVAVSADSITLRRVEGDETYARAELSFIGRVDPEPVGKDDGLTDEQRAEVKKLRKRLNQLGDEDDQIIRCSARYELEKKIYDIKNPVPPPYDLNEWPDELRIVGE